MTELCYSLKFCNPVDSDEYFVVHSLVEAMVLLAAHGKALPKPVRIGRCGDSVEARLNATNAALQPHAGGLIEYWSDAVEGEIRDDQGISLRNPDTNVFMKYCLAGAYDSNIALVLTVGEGRQHCYEQLADVLRRTRICGRDLATNLEFHYGLVNWFIGDRIHARPTTRFIVPYLTAVGELKQAASNIDLVYGYAQIEQRMLVSASDGDRPALRDALQHKYSLLKRPLDVLLRDPHLLSGWLSRYAGSCTVEQGRVCWKSNPMQLLADTYHFLSMDAQPGKPAAEMIWDHDSKLLQSSLDFYQTLCERLGLNGDSVHWTELEACIAGSEAEALFSEELCEHVRGAHRGFQAGLDMLAVLPWIARHTGFDELSLNADLSINIPERLSDPDHQAKMARELAPPPVASSNEILAQSGGMFYPRETPDSQPYVEVGSHFDKGDPLYIVEVMKMFNKVSAPFAGTVEQILVEGDGVIISKGQPLYRIVPDEQLQVRSVADIRAQRREFTDLFLQDIQPGQ